MLIGVPKEIFPGERRVALTPAALPGLKKAGFEVMIQAGAGRSAGFLDSAYLDREAILVQEREEIFRRADTVLQVLCHGSNDRNGREDLSLMRPGQVLIGFLRPLGAIETVQEVAATGATAFAIELMPRITRAQNMDALSSMATIAGYKAVVLAADTLPRLFPMFTTAAGTIIPARVFVIGTGVAGLQAIATAKRLGAVVSAYDVRTAAREQVQSVGGRFIELPIEAVDAEDHRGYARAQDENFYQRQRDLLGRVVAESDVLIAAAVVPGKKPPVLITRQMVEEMAPGSVIVDLAAERGGNCELTQSDKTVIEHDVTIIGCINLASTVPYHASQMYARNLTAFLLHVFKGGNLEIDLEDEITRETLLTRGGAVVNQRVRDLFSQSTAPVH
jgi:NAD(P) transhydrogenase subunit alpha